MTAPDPLTRELHQLLHGLGMSMRAHFERCASHIGLTVPQAAALQHLEEPLPMRDLANRLFCDASNVTGIVDRLEEAGLAERQAHPDDRRVKTVALTEQGRRRQREMRDLLLRDHPIVARLDAAERRTLRDLLAKAAVQEVTV